MRLADLIFKRNDWRMTSPFGPRRHPITGVQSMHNGTDYATGGQNWPLHAVESGTVTGTGWCNSRGRFVIINHSRLGRELHHFHMQRVDVRQGQAVSAGTRLGTTGTTGDSTGIHLHLGMRPSGGGAWQDPHAFVYSPPGAQAVTPAPTNPSNSSGFNVGDHVILNGPVFADSFGGGQGRTFTNHRGTITRAVDTSRAAPFHVDHIGWVRARDLKKV